MIFGVLTLPLILGLLTVLRGGAAVAQALLANRIGHGVVSDVQTELVGKLMHADLARLRATHTGGFVSQVLNDAGMIREAATTGLLNYVQSGLTIVVLLAVMLYHDWVLTLLVLLAGPIVGWVLRDFSKRITEAATGRHGRQRHPDHRRSWRAWTACAWSRWRTARPTSSGRVAAAIDRAPEAHHRRRRRPGHRRAGLRSPDHADGRRWCWATPAGASMRRPLRSGADEHR